MPAPLPWPGPPRGASWAWGVRGAWAPSAQALLCTNRAAKPGLGACVFVCGRREGAEISPVPPPLLLRLGRGSGRLCPPGAARGVADGLQRTRRRLPVSRPASRTSARGFLGGREWAWSLCFRDNVMAGEEEKRRGREQVGSTAGGTAMLPGEGGKLRAEGESLPTRRCRRVVFSLGQRLSAPFGDLPAWCPPWSLKWWCWSVGAAAARLRLCLRGWGRGLTQAQGCSPLS